MGLLHTVSCTPVLAQRKLRAAAHSPGTTKNKNTGPAGAENSNIKRHVYHWAQGHFKIRCFIRSHMSASNCSTDLLISSDFFLEIVGYHIDRHHNERRKPYMSLGPGFEALLSPTPPQPAAPHLGTYRIFCMHVCRCMCYPDISRKKSRTLIFQCEA